MPNPPPVTDAERSAILALHAQDVPRNEIARRVSRSPSSVTKVVHAAGGTFDRATRTALATRTVQADNRARRAALEQALLDDAARLRAQIWEPHEYIDHGGKEFIEVRWVTDEPSPADKLKLMQAAVAAADRSLKLANHDSDSGVDAAKSMLGAIADALTLAVDADPDTAP